VGRSCRTWLSSLGPVRAPATIPAVGIPPAIGSSGRPDRGSLPVVQGWVLGPLLQPVVWRGNGQKACNDAGQRDRQDRWTTHQSDRILIRDGFAGQQMPHRTRRRPVFLLIRLCIEPPAGIEPATLSLPWNHQEPLYGTPFPQVTPDRRGQSYRFSFGEVMRSPTAVPDHRPGLIRGGCPLSPALNSWGWMFSRHPGQRITSMH